MRCDTDRITTRRLLLAGSFGLTSSLLATTTHAGNCSDGKTAYLTADYKVQSTLPFVGYRYIARSNGVIYRIDEVMIPSPRSTSPTTPAPDTRVGGAIPKRTTTDISEETAL